MHVAVLGPLEVRNGDAPVVISGVRVRRLMIRLSVDAGRAVSADELVEAVWLDDPPANVHNALQALVSRLRRTMPSPRAVEQVGSGYRLTLPADGLDVDEFARHANTGRELLAAGESMLAAAELRSALDLWRGDALSEADDAPYARALSVRWNEQRLQACADLARAALANGSGAHEVAGLRELVAAHPLRDDFVELLMRALVQAGRTPEALSAFEHHRKVIADELGTDPATSLQALHLELLQAAPVEASPAGRSSNIPTPLTRLVGRDDEIARLSKQLADGRLATLVGPGGAGKTRLATEVVHRVGDAAGDDLRAWFVDLAPVTDLNGVVQAFGAVDGLLDRHVIDVPGERLAVDPIERLVDWLRPRDALLLVDNCEQVIGSAASVVSRLLASCPRLRVLATSREPLDIPGESLVHLEPLAFPDVGASVAEAMAHPAVQLFAERARDADQRFEVDDSNVDVVVEIVRGLDGLPLALELAAARLRVLPIAEVQRRLSDRFGLLTSGNRTAMPRHQTLRAVVEWSWDLLSESERLLLERLAVFPSGADLDATVGVCADTLLPDVEIPALLDSLVDKSLLKVGAEGGLRYRMLDTIRAFGNERLEARHEATISGRAHAAYFTSLVQRLEPALRTADQLPALAKISLERDNVLAALRFYGDQREVDAAMTLAVAMSWYWTMLGSHAESAYWTRFALDVAPGGDLRTRTVLETFFTMGSLAADASGAGSWQNIRERMVELGRQLEQFEFDEPPLLALRPMVMYFGGDPETAERLTSEALESADAWTRAAMHTFRAAMAENDGDVARMKADLEAATPDLEHIGDRWLLGSSLSSRGKVRTLEGDLDGAAADFELAAAAMQDIGAPDDLAFMHMRLAELAIRRNDLPAARRFAEELMRATSQWRPGELFYVALMLSLSRLEGDRAGGDAYYEQLRASVGTLPADHPIQDHTRSMQMASLASYDLYRGHVDEARAWLLEGYPAALGTHDMPIVAIVGMVVADLALASGQAERAATILGAAAAVRGAEDATDPQVVRITAALRDELGDSFRSHYDKGKRLGREDALPLLDPAAL